MRPRYSRDAPEIHTRYARIRPRYGRDTAEIRPRCTYHTSHDPPSSQDAYLQSVWAAPHDSAIALRRQLSCAAARGGGGGYTPSQLKPEQAEIYPRYSPRYSPRCARDEEIARGRRHSLTARLGCISATSRLYLRHISALFPPYLGCISTTSRLYLGRRRFSLTARRR